MQPKRTPSLLFDAILKGDSKESLRQAKKAIKEKIDSADVLWAVQQSMTMVGRKFEKREYFVPEVLCSAQAAEKVVKAMSLHIKLSSTLKQARIIVGTVQGDIHDIGKNILVTVLRSAGHLVHDLGTNVCADDFVAGLIENKANFLLMSALTTTTMLHMKEVIEAVEKAGLRKNVRVIIGGGPITEAFARDIGADSYGKNAFEALAQVDSFLRGK